MKSLKFIATFTAFLFVSFSANASTAIEAAAKKFNQNVNWRQISVVTGDFSCRGRKEVAILGTTKSEIVLAIFLNGLSKKPEILKYSAKARSADSISLTTEDNDFTIEDFEKEVGPIPPGLQPSKTCLGLNLSDGLVDSAHIYWNKKTRRFEDWVR